MDDEIDKKNHYKFLNDISGTKLQSLRTFSPSKSIKKRQMHFFWIIDHAAICNEYSVHPPI